VSEEAKVKRYTTHVTGLLVVRPDARSTYNENWTDVFLASDYDALARQLEEARAECLEQARIVGMGGEREARLMAQLNEARTDLAASRASERRMREAIEAHNAGCEGLCRDNSSRGHCEAYTSRKLQCPNCPRDEMIDLPPTDPHNDEVQP
jgi:hypothetical protein